MEGNLTYDGDFEEEEVKKDEFHLISASDGSLEFVTDDGVFEMLSPIVANPFCMEAERKFFLAEERGDWTGEIDNVRLKFILRSRTDMSSRVLYATVNLKVKPYGIPSAIVTEPAELAGFICAPIWIDKEWVAIRPMNLAHISMRPDGMIARFRESFGRCVNLPGHKSVVPPKPRLADSVVLSSEETRAYFANGPRFKYDFDRFLLLDGDDSILDKEFFVSTLFPQGWPSVYEEWMGGFNDITSTPYNKYIRGVVEKDAEGCYVFSPYEPVNDPWCVGSTFLVERQ